MTTDAPAQSVEERGYQAMFETMETDDFCIPNLWARLEAKLAARGLAVVDAKPDMGIPISKPASASRVEAICDCPSKTNRPMTRYVIRDMHAADPLTAVAQQMREALAQSFEWVELDNVKAAIVAYDKLEKGE